MDPRAWTIGYDLGPAAILAGLRHGGICLCPATRHRHFRGAGRASGVPTGGDAFSELGDRKLATAAGKTPAGRSRCSPRGGRCSALFRGFAGIPLLPLAGFRRDLAVGWARVVLVCGPAEETCRRPVASGFNGWRCPHEGVRIALRPT